ncbi:hypothetical protein FH972_015117 [Carpinus fangiana]|uniref:Protein kinase domain-containing protein n=1 Tax=Carpinus fangiana TaxID=176857 RepID=A0A5N6RF87_9ROSI|nr:hypothetical protein FH972_015117 [Carpinus fangiana]
MVQEQVPGQGGGRGGNNGGKPGVFSWEGEGQGNLVFCGAGDQKMSYGLEDLLKALVETLGRGRIGTTYKAVMESGYIVTVKRIKDARYPMLEEFRKHMHVLGTISHPNLVPLRAYFQAKVERLLVYDYFPNGSLFSLIHADNNRGAHHKGNRAGNTKPRTLHTLLPTKDKKSAKIGTNKAIKLTPKITTHLCHMQYLEPQNRRSITS